MESVTEPSSSLLDFPNVVIDISEDVICRPFRKQLRDVGGAYISAVNHSINIETFQHPYGIQRILQVAVRIAYNSNSHFLLAASGGWLSASTLILFWED